MTETAELAGRRFVAPAPVTMISEQDRCALALVPPGTYRIANDPVEFAVSEGAVDLSLVRTGRCPLLIDHSAMVADLIGVVLAADVEGNVLQAVVRFAPVPEADRLWSLLSAGFPLSLSAGSEIVEAETLPTGAARITRWRLRELSVTVHGRNEGAHVRMLGAGEPAAAMVAAMNAAPDHRRHAIEQRLRLASWRSWAHVEGLRLGERLGVDPDTAADLLVEAVRQHSEKLIAEAA